MAIKPGIARSVYKQPCRRPEGREESELCANWYSAKGSHDAAKWAFWQLWLSVFGVIGLGVTLLFNRQALKIAMDATRDADKALEIAERSATATANMIGTARENARRETKAYVGIFMVQIIDPSDSRNDLTRPSIFCEIIVSVKNYGKTPARSVRLKYGTEIATSIDNERIRFGEMPNSAGSDLSPSATFNVYIPLQISRVEHREITSATMSIYLYTKLSFDDVFDGGSMAVNTFCSNGSAYADGRMTSVLSGTTT